MNTVLRIGLGIGIVVVLVLVGVFPSLIVDTIKSGVSKVRSVPQVEKEASK